MPDQIPGSSNQVQRRARLRPGIRAQPGMRPGMWYPVLELNPCTDKAEARPGYVWIDLGTGEPPRHVWARHLEIKEV